MHFIPWLQVPFPHSLLCLLCQVWALSGLIVSEKAPLGRELGNRRVVTWLHRQRKGSWCTTNIDLPSAPYTSPLLAMWCLLVVNLVCQSELGCSLSAPSLEALGLILLCSAQSVTTVTFPSSRACFYFSSLILFVFVGLCLSHSFSVFSVDFQERREQSAMFNQGSGRCPVA